MFDWFFSKVAFVARGFEHPKGYKKLYSIHVRAVLDEASASKRRKLWNSVFKGTDLEIISRKQFEDTFEFSSYHRRIDGVLANEIYNKTRKVKNPGFSVEIEDKTSNYLEADAERSFVEDLSAKMNKAVEDGNPEEALKLKKQIQEIGFTRHFM